MRWIVGERHMAAWESAAHWVHANTQHPPGVSRDEPCGPCWRSAAYAVECVLMAGYLPDTR